ncbi:hypothetical protein [Streptomyces albus]|uniref:hypothetical protein n=1 Tax=Streptomyces albus TaxID=1888 RepID=UPI0004CC0D91|nr:hypothetical protein [Streptomyces albus]
MDLRNRLRRAALSRPGVMLVALPGATPVRLALEAELRRRGWPRSETPAAADLLVVAGDRDPLGGDSWLDGIWEGMPKPAVRLAVRHPGDAARALDAGHRLLREDVGTRHDLAPAAPPPGGESTEGRNGRPGGGPGERSDDGAGGHHDDGEGREDRAGRGGGGAGGHDDCGGDPGGHSDPAGEGGEQESGHGDGSSGHGDGHGGHSSHETHEMSEPGGLPMAERAEDRDGLTLDRLHLPLGPALPDWPAGLILRLVLQGDVVQRAVTETLPVRRRKDPFWDEPWLRAARGETVPRSEAARRRCAAHLDSLGRFLAVAGWDDPAARARRLRDGALSAEPGDRLREDVVSLARRVARSRALRLLTAGLGPLPAAEARAAGASGPARTADGDAYDRLLVWLDELDRAAWEFGDERPLARDDRTGPRGTLDGAAPPSQGLLDVLPGLLNGAEFAGARIVVASLDPDVEELTSVSRPEAADV